MTPERQSSKDSGLCALAGEGQATMDLPRPSVAEDSEGRPKELVIISGKGGTGKTSIAACFAALARGAVLADCDVDASDLHLLLAPRVIRREVFRAGREAVIRRKDCIACGACLARCRFGAVVCDGEEAGEAEFRIDLLACEGCGACVTACPVHAIDFPEKTCGEWYVSETRHGTMVHARLNPASSNSGKLVSIVRGEARRLAQAQGSGVVIVDGPPGIGCQAIASLAGASLALIVSEPSVSARHDFERVAALTRHFAIPTLLCVNKWDLNPHLTTEMEADAADLGIDIAPRLPYEEAFTLAQTKGQSLSEWRSCAARESLEALWREVSGRWRVATAP